MQLVAALFVDELDLRQVAGPSTRLDLTGVQFSAAAPADPPVTLTPHLIVLLRNETERAATGVLEVVFDLDDERLARSVQPVEIEAGMFAYRLVRAELEFDRLGTVEASCSVDRGSPIVVPFTLLAPVSTTT